jgi:peptide/nickel transport system substrate-binding protein
MLDLLNAQMEPDLTLNPYMKTVKKIVPAVSIDCMHHTFLISNDSAYIYTQTFPTGIPTTFFNNSHTRKAFAYAFNSTLYTEQVWYGEANYRKNPLVLGLYPDYYNESVPGYDQDFAAAKAELQAAIFNGTSVWDSGFKLGLAFNIGNTQRQIACQMIKDFFTALSIYGGRVGPAFQVELVPMSWDDYLDAFETYMLPIWDIGWLADFADADNFIRPYMHSNGDFTYFQDYTAANGWGTTKDLLIDQALVTADGPARAAVYQQLALIYYNDCPSIPITIPQGRRWCQYWVKGCYYDALYPATYIPSVYKYDDSWFDIAGPAPIPPDVQIISDGIVNIRDIFYLVLHFNAKAPVPGIPVDPKWVGTYSGNGGVDPYGDRISNIRDIFGAVLKFNAKNNTLTP